MSDDLAKLHIHKETPEGTLQLKYPGPINETEGFEAMMIDEAFLKHPGYSSDTY
jgi:hypothetical protein